VLGLILGPIAEQQFRRALAISQGDYTVFVSRPISAVLLASAAAVLIVPLVLGRRGTGAGPA
jgi:putative tricarboxylic transport membrane protein